MEKDKAYARKKAKLGQTNQKQGKGNAGGQTAQLILCAACPYAAKIQAAQIARLSKAATIKKSALKTLLSILRIVAIASKEVRPAKRRIAVP